MSDLNKPKRNRTPKPLRSYDNAGLQPHVEKALLQAIVDAGGRGSFAKISRVLNTNKALFGEPNTARRKQCQNKWNNAWSKHSDAEFDLLLYRYGINQTPCPAIKESPSDAETDFYLRQDQEPTDLFAKFAIETEPPKSSTPTDPKSTSTMSFVIDLWPKLKDLLVTLAPKGLANFAKAERKLVEPREAAVYQPVFISHFQNYERDEHIHEGYTLMIEGIDPQDFVKEHYRAWLLPPSQVLIQYPTLHATTYRDSDRRKAAEKMVGVYDRNIHIGRETAKNEILASQPMSYMVFDFEEPLSKDEFIDEDVEVLGDGARELKFHATDLAAFIEDDDGNVITTDGRFSSVYWHVLVERKTRYKPEGTKSAKKKKRGQDLWSQMQAGK